jgi:type IV pilus assembly protein PilQ
MNRAPRILRTAGGLFAIAALLAAAPARPTTPTADVTGVSIRSAPRRAELVIDVRGVVEVSDFVLANPARLVVDLVGAHLVAPLMQYDGVTRAGIRNVRYAQFRPDVVRVVVELDSARDYDVRQEDGAVRVGFVATEDFAIWTSSTTTGESRLVSAPPSAPVADASAAALVPTMTASLPRAIPRPAPAARNAEPAVQQDQATQQPHISITLDHATVEEVVANFAAFSGRSIVLGKDIAGVVTAEIRDQPWDVALNAILAGQGLSVIQLPGGILRVDSRAALAAQDSLEPVITRVVQIDYVRATTLQPSIVGVVSTRGKIIADSVTNSIIVTELASRIANIETFIKSLDTRTPQVAIQARIIFVDRTELEELGVRYDLSTASQFYTDLIPNAARPNPSPSTANPVVNLGGNAIAAIANASQSFTGGAAALKVVYSTVLGNFALTTFVEALQSVSLADLQAEPSVTVADNHNANIFSGEDTPIRQIDAGSSATSANAARATTSFKRTGIKLDVTPHVVAGTREILMLLHAERSQVVPVPISEIGAVFAIQEANTQLLIRDGETAVIGGLTVTEITMTKSGIPFLVDLPVIGPLFGFRSSKETRRDLLILVTPHIVDDLTTAGTGGQNR